MLPYLVLLVCHFERKAWQSLKIAEEAYPGNYEILILSIQFVQAQNDAEQRIRGHTWFLSLRS